MFDGLPVRSKGVNTRLTLQAESQQISGLCQLILRSLCSMPHCQQEEEAAGSAVAAVAAATMEDKNPHSLNFRSECPQGIATSPTLLPLPF